VVIFQLRNWLLADPSASALMIVMHRIEGTMKA
jgi:hypothetical protein